MMKHEHYCGIAASAAGLAAIQAMVAAEMYSVLSVASPQKRRAQTSLWSSPAL
jgi:hypothetical protein